MTIFELREKSLKIAHEARAKLAEIAADGSNAAEVEAEFDRMIADSDTLAARANRLEQVEARERDFASIVTPVNSTVEARASDVERADNAFHAYLRGEISDMELRSQSIGQAADGGYTVPTTMSNELIKSLKAFGPMNEGGPVRYILTPGGNPLVMPTSDDTGSKGRMIAEGVAVDESTVKFGQVSLGAFKFTSGMFKVSSELLSDSSQDVARIVNDAMAERLGRIFNEKYTVGSGTNEPQGIVTAAGVGKTAATATAIALADLIDLKHSVDPAYRAGAGYMWHDSTFAAVRKLTDSTGRLLWQAAYTVGAPDSFDGSPCYINQDMPVIATGNKSVLFGDFSKFAVRRAGGFVLRRLNELFAGSDQTGFVAFARGDSKLLDTAAIKALKQA